MPALSKILLYTRDMEKTSQFYQKHFDFEAEADEDGRVIELVSPSGGASIMLHQAARSVKLGQAAVKLVFEVEDVDKFKKKAAKLGLNFGATHAADGYAFANAKDPDKNSVSISSRSFRP